MDKVLTIIIPTYNMEKYLRRCLDSLIIDEEGMKLLEVLVINDGSKDTSSQIAHEYQDKYPNTFRVIDKENGNYGSCINRGLEEAAGRYTKILDSDDCYYTENFQEFITLLKDASADIVFSPFDTYTFDSILKNKMECIDFPNGKIFDIDEIKWPNRIEGRYRAMHCMAVSTAILKGNHYHQTEGISYTDTQFIFYSVLYSKTCAFYDKPIYKYYIGREGQTMSKASLKKSYLHFHKNARVMMDTFMILPATISENKRSILFACLNSCFLPFINTILSYVFLPVQELSFAKKLIEDSKKCKLRCPLADFSNRQESLVSLKRDFPLFLWNKMHVPSFFIYFLSKIRFLELINKCRI